jgi:hypothetical protein
MSYKWTLKALLVLGLLMAIPSLGFAQTSYPPVTLAFPHIAVGGDPAGGNYVTVLQIVNNNSAPTTGHFDLLSDTGTAFPVLVDGTGPSSTIDLTLSPGETRQILLFSTGAITSGWMRATYTPSAASTTVLAQYRSGTALVSEVGIAPASSTLLTTDLVFENDGALNNGIAVSNPSGATQYILAGLWNASTGAFDAGTVLSVPPNGHLARFVTEMFPNNPGVAQSRVKVSLDSCSNSSCTAPGGNGFVATVLRLNGDQLTSIAVAERSANDDDVHLLPQVAFGGAAGGQNMKTILYFTTNASAGVAGVVNIYDNDGNPLNASVNGGASTSVFSFTVQSNRVTKIVLTGDNTLRSGWAKVTLPSTANLTTNAIFQTFNVNTLVSEASVLESAEVQRGLIFVKTQPSTNVGIAFANPTADAKTISLDLYDQQGNVVARHDIALGPNGHLARFVTELFPEIASLTEFSGSMALHSTATFSAVALRLTGDKIATLPIATDGMHRPAISQLRFVSKSNNPMQVSFSVDVSDLDADLSTNAALPIFASGILDFGAAGVGTGGISIDGSAVVNASVATLSGTFQPSNASGVTVPAGTPAVFYLRVFDALGNGSNLVSIPVTF